MRLIYTEIWIKAKYWCCKFPGQIKLVHRMAYGWTHLTLCWVLHIGSCYPRWPHKGWHVYYGGCCQVRFIIGLMSVHWWAYPVQRKAVPFRKVSKDINQWMRMDILCKKLEIPPPRLVVPLGFGDCSVRWWPMLSPQFHLLSDSWKKPDQKSWWSPNGFSCNCNCKDHLKEGR